MRLVLEQVKLSGGGKVVICAWARSDLSLESGSWKTQLRIVDKTGVDEKGVDEIGSRQKRSRRTRYQSCNSYVAS